MVANDSDIETAVQVEGVGRVNQAKDGVRNKVELLKLAKTLGSVSQACKAMGFSRDSFYRFRELYEVGGAQALAGISRRKPNLKNRADPAVEQAVVAFAMAHPTCGQVRVSQALKERSLQVSPAGVRTIWLRYDLQTAQQRLAALSARARQPGLKLSAEQHKALAKLRTTASAGHGPIPLHPGFLGAQDAFPLGEVKGVGRLFVHVFIDTYSQVALAKLHESKEAQAAADLLKERVLPFFKGFGVPLQRLVTGRGRQYQQRGPASPFTELLAVNGIDQARAAGGEAAGDSPCDSFFRTASADFFAPTLRSHHFAALGELQAALDRWLEHYNAECPHTGRYCYGKTPLETFIESAPLP